MNPNPTLNPANPAPVNWQLRRTDVNVIIPAAG
jgi:hypothetical protein